MLSLQRDVTCLWRHVISRRSWLLPHCMFVLVAVTLVLSSTVCNLRAGIEGRGRRNRTNGIACKLWWCHVSLCMPGATWRQLDELLGRQPFICIIYLSRNFCVISFELSILHPNFSVFRSYGTVCCACVCLFRHFVHVDSRAPSIVESYRVWSLAFAELCCLFVFFLGIVFSKNGSLYCHFNSVLESFTCIYFLNVGSMKHFAL